MAQPHYCSNPSCRFSDHKPPRHWFVRAGFYSTGAHGRVQRFRCTSCNRRLSGQTESIHYFAKRRVDLHQIASRIRGGSSMRDIGREIGVSRTCVANAALRVARQAIIANLSCLCGLHFSGRLAFDGLISAVCTRDYPCHITTLGDTHHELLLAMTHAVTERGGTRTPAQRSRLTARRAVYRPGKHALSNSIALLVNELPRFHGPRGIHLDIDEHPLYPAIITADLAMRWYRSTDQLSIRYTSAGAPRTTSNPLFFVNYIDRMIRHRMSEHARESIAIARNATMQMHRMWIFAWDHNGCQPKRVAGEERRSRLEVAGVSQTVITRIKKSFYTRRMSFRGLPVSDSIRRVWTGQIESPPVRWKSGHRSTGPRIAAFAIRDLESACIHA